MRLPCTLEMTLSQYSSQEIDGFVAELERQEITGKTAGAYAADVTSFASWTCDNTGAAFAVRAVTPTNLLDYKAHLFTVRQYRAATVNRHLASLRKFFLWAEGIGLITDLPTEAVKGLPERPRVRKVLTQRNEDRLLRVVERDGGKRDLAIVLLLLRTGVRVREVCNLHLGELLISENHGHIVVRSGKTHKERTIPLIDEVREALAAYLLVRPQIANDHVFIGQRGDPLHSDGVHLIVRKYAQRAGLAGVTPHVLRHSFAKHLLDNGMQVALVSRLLGHARKQTTTIYTQRTVDDVEEVSRQQLYRIWERQSHSASQA
jgi:integrase/recombinase XerD